MKTIIGPVWGRSGHKWGIRILLSAMTGREPVAWVFANGLRLQIGLRWKPWFRSGKMRDPDPLVEAYHHARWNRMLACEDAMFAFHAASGGDLPCVCGCHVETKEVA